MMDCAAADAGGAKVAGERERFGVLATVVTYNPGSELLENLRALRQQVEQVLVVDNGSADLAAVQRACAAADCELRANERNLGIAAALNQAVSWALERGADWLATFDQDSRIPAGAVATLLDVVRRHPAAARIGIASMTHTDSGTGRPYHHWSDVLEEDDDWRVLRSTITSGSLVRRQVLQSEGGFEERLFIDFVDHEYCMRLRRRGWLVMEARNVVMSHSIGASRIHNVLGRPTVATHHSPLRRYYMTRNQLEIYTRNLAFDPAWALRGLATLAVGTVFVLLLEDRRWSKAAAMLQAAFDFATRRFGPRS